MKHQLATRLFLCLTLLFAAVITYSQNPAVPEYTADEPQGWDRTLYATFADEVPGVLSTFKMGIDGQGRVFISVNNLVKRSWLAVFGTDGYLEEAWDGGASGTPGRITSIAFDIEFDNSDNAYLSMVDTVDNQIYIYNFDKNGTFIRRVAIDFLLGGLAVSNSMGKVIINNDADTTVNIYNLDLSLDKKIKRPGMAPTEKFKLGDNMLYDEGVGRFYFKQRSATKTILTYDENFNIVRHITGTYATSFINATSGGFDVHPQTHDLWLQIGTNQNYFIIDTLGNLKGRFLDTSLGGTDNCRRFRFDKKGNLYTGNACKTLIYRYSPKVTGLLKSSSEDAAIVAYPSPNSGSFQVISPFPIPLSYVELISPDGKIEKHDNLDIQTELRGLLMVRILYENGSHYQTKVLVE